MRTGVMSPRLMLPEMYLALKGILALALFFLVRGYLSDLVNGVPPVEEYVIKAMFSFVLPPWPASTSKNEKYANHNIGPPS